MHIDEAGASHWLSLVNFSCTNNLIDAEPTQIQDGLGLQSFRAYKIRPQRTLQANEWIG